MSNLELCQELEQNMIDYAYAVNSDRAIPSVVDGLKPVARRILWTMNEDKAFSNKAHVKSARIVGSCMGKYHPHGDSSIYEAMIRLSQDWVMRYPLIDVHGNVGGVTGDGPAAARYTEARLQKMSEQGFLANVGKKVVDMQPNYSEDLEEPTLLPAIFPNILCNPNEGIGVAMACKWLPHNLNDVADIIYEYINSNKIDCGKLYPDFPGGGTIINKDEVKSIYTTGKGKVILQAKYKEEKRGLKDLLVFYEIPYQVFLEPLIDQIGKAFDDGKIVGITKVQDESGKKGIRVVVELEKGADKDRVLNQLFAETDLQKQINANCVGLVGKTPKLLKLVDVIELYVEHNISAIVKEHEYEFGKANTRIEILEGLCKALESIDEIVTLIRASKSAANAKTELIAKYNFTEPQAKAILDMKLARLSNLESVEVYNELQEKQEYAAKCQEVVANRDKQLAILCDRLQQLQKLYGDDRRTDVIQAAVATKAKTAKTKAEEIPEDIIVVFKGDSYLQAIPVAQAVGIGKAYTQFKLQTTDLILLFSNQGRFFRIAGKDIKQCGPREKGTAIGSIINLEPGEKIISVFSSIVNEKFPYILFTTEKGTVKKTEKIDYLGSTRNLNGMLATKLKDKQIISVKETNGCYILLKTKKNYQIKFSADEVRVCGRPAIGVKGITLSSDDEVIESIIIEPNSNSFKDIKLQKRGGKGTLCQGK